MKLTYDDALEDIEKLKWRMTLINITGGLPISVEPFSKYGIIYPFTNERLKSVFKSLNFKDNILTVTASMDQALYAILNGVKTVDAFDINKLTKYFAELKITAIKTLDYKEFMKFYKISEIDCNIYYNLNFLKNMDTHIFKKIVDKMTGAYAYFFELFYDFLKEYDDYYDELINYNYKPCYSGYLNENSYYELREKLKQIKPINYYECDVFDLKNKIGKNKYSAILFSNIANYFNQNQLNQFLMLLENLNDNLTEDAICQFGYGSLKKKNIIGSNRIDKKFVDDNSDVLFDVIDKDKVITFYKRLN